MLEKGKLFHTHKGAIAHDDLLGRPEGVIVSSTGGVDTSPFARCCPTSCCRCRAEQLSYTRKTQPRSSASSHLPWRSGVRSWRGLRCTHVFFAARRWLVGFVHSYERRPEFAKVARENVTTFFGSEPANWALTVGDLVDVIASETVDRVVLDMLAPWECIHATAEMLRPGGVLCAYVATTTQLSNTAEALRSHGGFTEPASSETIVRTWHVDALAVRPDHRMIGHTGFLVVSRRLAPGVVAPPRRRRSGKGRG